ncbi:MAG: neutral/alkaline non-lysosomal ceramidase N-terminal domain-containing protein [Actinomycetota bacterium]
MRIGSLAIVCCPGEFTTVAGARLRRTVEEALAGSGIGDVVLMTYCNDYMGYVTTAEEYEEQAYEGGHTVFGRHTLGAFRTVLAELAPQLTRERDGRTHDVDRRPSPVPADELALRSDLRPA